MNREDTSMLGLRQICWHNKKHNGLAYYASSCLIWLTLPSGELYIFLQHSLLYHWIVGDMQVGLVVTMHSITQLHHQKHHISDFYSRKIT